MNNRPTMRVTRRAALGQMALLAGGGVLLAACGGSAAGSISPSAAASSAAPKPVPLEKATISADPTSVLHVWTVWGIQRGLFRKNGIDLQVIDNVTDGPAALGAGQIDFLATGTGTLAGAVRGAPIRSQVLTFRDNYAMMVVPSIGSVAELKGKKVIGQNDMMKATLRSKGLADPDKDITWVVSRGTYMQNIEFVKSGQADGYAGFPPVQYAAEKAGLKTLVKTSDVFPGVPVSNCGTSIKLMTERPDFVKKMIAAVLDSTADLKANRPLVIDYFKTAWTFDDDLAAKAYSVIENDTLTNGKTDDQYLRLAIDVVSAAQGQTKKLEIKDVYDFTLLDQVLAERARQK